MHYLHPEDPWPMPKTGFLFGGGQLTDEQLDQIRLDPEEHSEWAVHDWDHWEQIMHPDSFTRLRAVENARLRNGHRLLITGSSQPNCETSPSPTRWEPSPTVQENGAFGTDFLACRGTSTGMPQRV